MVNSERGRRNAEQASGKNWAMQETRSYTKLGEGGTGSSELGRRNFEQKRQKLKEGNGERGSRSAERGMRKRIEMGKDELSDRTKAFALRVITLTNVLPSTPVARIIRNQLLRCGTSVGANYRAAKRAKSTADFISKMGTVEEETDESMYWMELIMEAELMKEDRISDLYQEADEILAMVVASIKAARRNK